MAERGLKAIEVMHSDNSWEEFSDALDTLKHVVNLYEIPKSLKIPEIKEQLIEIREKEKRTAIWNSVITNEI
jgi:hypothetical protein